MERQLISPEVVQDALAVAQFKDIPLDVIFAQAGLKNSLQDWLTAGEFGRLWLALAKVTDDEFFGLSAKPMRRGSFEMICHAVIGSATLGEALRRLLRFLALVMDGPCAELYIREGQAIIELEGCDGPYAVFAARSYWLLVMGISSWLIGKRIPLLQVTMDRAAPIDRPSYLNFFGLEVRFGAKNCSLSFGAEWLKLPVKRNPAALKRFLAAAPGNLLLRYHTEGGLGQAIARDLMRLEPAEWPDLPQIAQSMNMSAPTLRRKLRAEEASFAEIREKILAQRASQLLRETRLTVTEISEKLGYSEPSAFYRAFRKVFATTPAAYRGAD